MPMAHSVGAARAGYLCNIGLNDRQIPVLLLAQAPGLLNSSLRVLARLEQCTPDDHEVRLIAAVAHELDVDRPKHVVISDQAAMNPFVPFDELGPVRDFVVRKIDAHVVVEETAERLWADAPGIAG